VLGLLYRTKQEQYQEKINLPSWRSPTAGAFRKLREPIQIT